MSPADEQHVKDVLRFFYPDEAPPAQVSDEVGNLAAEMLHEALLGSKAMDFVPRPAGFKPGLAWLVSQAVQMACGLDPVWWTSFLRGIRCPNR
jgi:hypothetical protein